jgi:hypothetical protein
LSKHVVLHCGPHTIEWAHFERCFDLWVPLDKKLTTSSFFYSVSSHPKDLVDKSQEVAPRVPWDRGHERKTMRDDGVQQLVYLVQRKKILLSGDSNGLTWKEALQLSRDSLCSQIHDKIFGLLGIVHTPLRFPADYDKPPADFFEILLKLEIEEEPDARCAMFHHSGPPVLTHIREANVLAEKLGVDLSHDEIGKIVEEIYLQAGHREYIDALSAGRLYDGIPSSYHDHWDDISSVLALAPVVRTVCVLRKPEPMDP